MDFRGSWSQSAIPDSRGHAKLWWAITRVCTLFLGLFGLALSATAAVSPPFRPVPAAGMAAPTLLIYSAQRTAFSLVDAVESLSMHLRRADIALETVSLEMVSSNQLALVDYVVVFCPEDPGMLPESLLESLSATHRPVLWVGRGWEQLYEPSQLQDPSPGPVTPAELVSSRLVYRDRAWVVPPSAWWPRRGELDPAETVIMSAAAQTPGDATHPVCWKKGHLTFFSGVPQADPLGYLLGDLLLDFFEVKQIPPNQLFLRLADYHPGSRHRHFLRLIDFLYARRLPFLVSVTPALKDSVSGRVADLDNTPEFAEALRYAQQRGGRLVMRGCLRQDQGPGEFWDLRLDRPLNAEATAGLPEELARRCRQLLRHGLYPLAWESPDYAASSSVLAEVARFFSTAVERLPLSDTTRSALATPAGLTRDRFGRMILPENLGSVAADAASPYEGILARADPILQLRGTVVGCDFHVYLSLDLLMGLVEKLDSLQVPYLDLLQMDHWVRWPGGMLLTGQATLQTEVSTGPVRWRALDAQGRMVGETTAATLFSGPQRLERRGLGALELYQSMEGEP